MTKSKELFEAVLYKFKITKIKLKNYKNHAPFSKMCMQVLGTFKIFRF